eukprot:COSAG03_NODE_10173_length_667_cov_0.811620_1_plen_157_part_00
MNTSDLRAGIPYYGGFHLARLGKAALRYVASGGLPTRQSTCDLRCKCRARQRTTTATRTDTSIRDSLHPPCVVAADTCRSSASQLWTVRATETSDSRHGTDASESATFTTVHEVDGKCPNGNGSTNSPVWPWHRVLSTNRLARCNAGLLPQVVPNI